MGGWGWGGRLCSLSACSDRVVANYKAARVNVSSWHGYLQGRDYLHGCRWQEGALRAAMPVLFQSLLLQLVSPGAAVAAAALAPAGAAPGLFVGQQ